MMKSQKELKSKTLKKLKFCIMTMIWKEMKWRKWMIKLVKMTILQMIKRWNMIQMTTIIECPTEMLKFTSKMLIEIVFY